ncbi:MAG: GMC family oxidoreductase N-terminal domain-containing protein [Flammeovirgaceae bacterium]|nr:GMC family oxidoreductase N-terminal domain-containing protein [Flammeovirgaceae bacterium]
MKEQQEYDYIIVGSGFGGSVSAMRLAEKGYKVLVIEKGKRFQDKDYPKSDWNFRKFFWAPIIRCFGIQKLTFFKEVFILSGVGVGGGSHVYGNTHMVPGDEFFNNPLWGKFKNWKEVLMPFYEKAKFMLGTVPYTRFNDEDLILREVAKDMNKEDSFEGVNVGVYYGDTKQANDPYFKGLGPERLGCQECAACMVGCRHNAKNTLDKNYLYFAEKFGATILPETKVEKILFKNGSYHLETKSSTAFLKKDSKTFQSKGLVISGGVLGTMNLLLSQKHSHKTLKSLSDRLGENIMTNSESLCGVTNADRKLNNGVAISSVFNPDNDTHIEVVKYNNESGVLGKLSTFATSNSGGIPRPVKMILEIIKRPIGFLKMLIKKSWGKNTVIFLVMQSLSNSMKLQWKKGVLGGGISFVNQGLEKVPSYIPIGQEVMNRYAKKVNGTPVNALTEVVFNMATTAHILGGCPMGKNIEEGVVDDHFAVHGYPNMYILDGSIIPCNLGVNPSLSITALSEYAMSNIPEKAGNNQKSLDEQLEERTVAK